MLSYFKSKHGRNLERRMLPAAEAKSFRRYILGLSDISGFRGLGGSAIIARYVGSAAAGAATAATVACLVSREIRSAVSCRGDETPSRHTAAYRRHQLQTTQHHVAIAATRLR